MHRYPRSVHQYEQRSRFVRNFYLLVIMGLADFAIAGQQRRIQFPCSLNRFPKQWRSDAMQLRIGWVQQNESVLAEHASEQLGVSSRESLALSIAFPQIVRRQRLAQYVRRLRHQFVSALREPYIRHRRVRFAIGRKRKRSKLQIAGQQQRLIDFREVVIFRGHPENRHARNARTLHLSRQRQHRGGLEQGQQWAPKQTDLLPGDYSVRAVA